MVEWEAWATSCWRPDLSILEPGAVSRHQELSPKEPCITRVGSVPLGNCVREPKSRGQSGACWGQSPPTPRSPARPDLPASLATPGLCLGGLWTAARSGSYLLSNFHFRERSEPHSPFLCPPPCL